MLSPEKLTLPAPRFLVVGGDGLIGRGLVDHWSRAGEKVVSTSRKPSATNSNSLHLDLAESLPESLPSCGAAVFCAAVTSLDQCRRHPEDTRRVNVTHTLELITRLADAGSFVVFLSTNLVFDGTRPRRRAADAPCPMTEYGRQKAEVEAGMARFGENAAIIRLTKVFHPGMPLLSRWAADFKAGRPVEAYLNYHCSPITAEAAVSGIARVAAERRGGLWQFSGPGDVSYASIAMKVRELVNLPVAPLELAAVPEGKFEHNPAHTALDAGRASGELDLQFAGAGRVVEWAVNAGSEMPG